MKKRLLSLPLCLLMMFSFLPTMTAFATEAQGKVTTTKQLVSEVPDENGNYTIRLTVRGNPITTNVKPNADVVLVVDNSTSMAEPARSPRIRTAKNAGKTFAQGILTKDSGNKMAVIGFSSRNYSYIWGWYGNPIDVKTGLVDNQNTINNAIDSMTAEGGTNYSSALGEAYNILSERSDVSRPGYVIFISDGAPGLFGDSQDDPDWNGSRQIQQLKNAGITIYTVGIALDNMPANYLKSMATSNDHFINLSENDLESQLVDVLANWASMINCSPAGTNAVMTDIINSDGFEFVSSDEELIYNDKTNTLTWEIGDIPEYERSVTFKIKPKEGVYGEIATNKSCVLDYLTPEGEQKSIDIASPIVKIPSPVTYNIIFDPNGGSVTPTSGTTGVDGKLTSIPTPDRADYSFDGWFTEKTGGTVIDTNTVFTTNATVYAHWTYIGNENVHDYYTVTFHTNGGSAVLSQMVQEGNMAKKPADPQRSGYTFDGWFSNSSLSTSFNFSQSIYKDTDVYAKWIKDDYINPIPQTGDSSNTGLWITMITASMLSIGLVIYGRKRRTTK